MVYIGSVLLFVCLLINVLFTWADESIAFSTNFRETTWFSFKMTGRSDKGFQSVSLTPPSGGGMRVCDVAKVKQPENLLISPFIQPVDSVRKVMIDLKFEVEDLKNKSISVALVETDSPIDFKQWRNSNFNVVKSRFGNNWVQISEYLELELLDNRKGFHMAFLDTGACIRLLSMQVKYLFCPILKANLSLFDRTTTFVTTIQGQCVSNARAQSAPENHCKSSGVWRKQKPDANCECSAGFEPDSLFQSCQRCVQDYYKPTLGNNRCQRCPANSERLPYTYNRAQVPAVKCDCKSNYFRTNNEPIDVACATVPSKPLDFEVDVKYTTFSLKWNRPTSNGGRTDLYYEVRICPRESPLCEPDTLRGDVRHFESTGYSPEQEYTIKVCAMNGVSLMMRADIMERRSCQTQTLSTGKELKVRNLELVPEGETVAIQWQQPDVYVSDSDLLNYSVTVLMGRSAFSHVTTSNSRAAFSGLSSGEYTFSVVARYNGMAGPAVNFTQRIQGLGDGDYQVTIFNTPEPGVLLMVGVVGIVLLILITVFVSAVCILRKKHCEWERTIPHHSSLLEYESNKQMPSNYLGYTGLPYDFSMPVGQTFIDPHYYNLEEMLHEYTQPIDPANVELDLPIEGIFLGSGFFGFPGTCNLTDQYPNKHAVFVKMCKQGEPDQLKELFFMEASILGQFNHPNVLQLMGVALKGEPMMMVTEYTSGSLLDCLVNFSYMQKSPSLGTGVVKGENSLYWSPSQIIHQMRGVACGMQYLSELGYVHKVLCCKNVLISENGVCKITGFDQRIMLDQEQFVFGDHGVSAEILPWSPPEVYNMRKYSTQSDSWSFGVMLWEIFSFPTDHRPYFNRTNIEIIRMVDGGFRLPLPRSCPLIVYELMKTCWDQERSKRPDFGVIQEQLHLMVRRQDLLQHQHQDNSTATVTNAPATATLNMKSSLSLTTTSVNTLPRVNSMGGGSSGGANNYYIMPVPVSDWLHSLKLHQYIDSFTKNSINTTDDVISSIDGPILEQMGVRSNRHRQKILDGIVKLKKGAMNNSPPSNTTSPIAPSQTMSSCNSGKIYDVKYAAHPGGGNTNFQSTVFSEI